MYDLSPRKNYTSKNRLDEQIAATGHSIKDVKAVLMGHLRAWPEGDWYSDELTSYLRCRSFWGIDAFHRH